MTTDGFRRLDRRAFLAGVAICAFAGSTLLTARAQETAEQDDQAEWRQSYETSDRISVRRESTPTLSAATVTATEQAIQTYQSIVARGGWNMVPAVELRVGVTSRAVPALRQRLIASGDLDQVAGMGQTFDSFVEAAVKRFQIRHGLGASGAVNSETIAALNVSAEARLQQLETNIVRLRTFA
ncbi:MAG: peptidoglycan-binding protein, partial [Hyphomicrobiales bacterium]|nr:peptidoglycan-binding protein [Hyphomicrobiales bacterium]